MTFYSRHHTFHVSCRNKFLFNSKYFEYFIAIIFVRISVITHMVPYSAKFMHIWVEMYPSGRGLIYTDMIVFNNSM
jgi:hypothetical protein